jgi:hypothetical protein
MTVSVYTPTLSVLLVKTVKATHGINDRFLGKQATIDLSPYLTEGSSVSTTKAVNSPNGNFTIRLGDRLVEADSLYGLVEPMDVVEIRMSRSGNPVLIMRGIVTNTKIDESVSSSGKPTRTVTISGGDYGCILRMIQIHSIRGASIPDLLKTMSSQYMQEMYGVPYLLMAAGDFVQVIVEKVVNQHIAKIGNPSMPGFTVDVTGADPEDSVYPQGFQANPDGTMWSHLQKHGNLGPFYEVLIDDDDQATTLVYRKPAFKALTTGEFIFPTSGAETFSVKPSDITSMSSSRSEHDVSNFYYVRSPRWDFFTSIDTKLLSVVGNGTQLSKADYPNCAESLYGFRSMEVETNHGSLASDPVRGKKAAEVSSGENAHATYMLKQIDYLQKCNIDNVVFESGSIRCNGSPDYKPGRYFNIAWSSGLESSGYVTTVTHTFEQFKGYTCTLQFIRGTGFANRTKSDHPYFRGKGVY